MMDKLLTCQSVKSRVCNYIKDTQEVLIKKVLDLRRILLEYREGRMKKEQRRVMECFDESIESAKTKMYHLMPYPPNGCEFAGNSIAFTRRYSKLLQLKNLIDGL